MANSSETTPDMNTLVEQIHQLEHQLEQQLQVSLATRKEPKVASPKAFTGKRTESQEFILKCETVFMAQTRTYYDDKTKLAFTINLLEHEAYEWVKPALLAPYDKSPEWIQSWDAFKKEFFKVFSDVDIKELSYQRLQALKQTGSASTYANDFRRHSLNLDWNDEPLRQHFFRGLKPEVKDRVLSPTDFTDLTSLMESAIKWDNLLYQRRRDPSNNRSTERSYTHSTTRQSNDYKSSNQAHHSSPVHTLGTGPTPMEVDSIRGPLSQAEKDRRRKNNLCLYCGNPGHRALECRKRSSPPQPGKSIASIESTPQVQQAKESPQ